MTEPGMLTEHASFRTLLEHLEARELATGNHCVLLIEGEQKTVAALLHRTDEPAQLIHACEAIYERTPYPHVECITVVLSDAVRHLVSPPLPPEQILFYVVMWDAPGDLDSLAPFLAGRGS